MENNNDLQIEDNYVIPQWQIDEVRKRHQAYLKNPEIAIPIKDLDKFFDDLESELKI